MKELRCIVFTDREVVNAVVDRRKRLADPVPGGRIVELQLNPQPDGQLLAVLRNTNGDVLEVGDQELQAALVAYCMSRNVPLPVEAEKAIHLIKSRATLMVTMNFQKGARLITAAAAEALAQSGGN